jgi:hypothetical protein
MIARIQQNMIKSDIDQMLAGGYDTAFYYTDISYLVFLIIGIIGYFSVPSITNYIVHASGGNVLMSKVNSMTTSAFSAVAGGGAGATGAGASSGSSAGSMAADSRVSDKMSYNLADAGNSEGYLSDGGYQQKRISG